MPRGPRLGQLWSQLPAKGLQQWLPHSGGSRNMCSVDEWHLLLLLRETCAGTVFRYLTVFGGLEKGLKRAPTSLPGHARPLGFPS